jgi:hypothetical protein
MPEKLKPNEYDPEELKLKQKKIYDYAHKLVRAIEAAHCPCVDGRALNPDNYIKIFNSILVALAAADPKTCDEIVDYIELLLTACDIRHGGDEMQPGERVKLMWLPEVK